MTAGLQTKTDMPAIEKRPNVLLALDETQLTGAAISWTIKNIVNRNDRLIIAACALPDIPIGRSPDGFLAYRKREAARMESRLKAIVEIILKELKMVLEVEFNIHLFKPEQADHIAQLVHLRKPRKIILYLDNQTQPWLHRMLKGDISAFIALKCPIKPTILNDELLRKLDECNIWGCI